MKYCTSCCKTSAETGKVLLDFEGVSIGSKVAAEVDGITLAKVAMLHPFDV